jgi:hypothetical protein
MKEEFRGSHRPRAGFLPRAPGVAGSSAFNGSLFPADPCHPRNPWLKWIGDRKRKTIPILFTGGSRGNRAQRRTEAESEFHHQGANEERTYLNGLESAII